MGIGTLPIARYHVYFLNHVILLLLLLFLFIYKYISFFYLFANTSILSFFLIFFEILVNLQWKGVLNRLQRLSHGFS